MSKIDCAPVVILRLPQVKAKTGISRSGIYQKIAEGNFPDPVSLGPRAVGWIESEIEGWLEKTIAKRGQELLNCRVSRNSCSPLSGNFQHQDADSDKATLKKIKPVKITGLPRVP